jgi:two-component system cell cycle sensor histidine kinase PleC
VSISKASAPGAGPSPEMQFIIFSTVFSQYTHAETTLKRAIPMLIVAFLAVVAASHFFGMLSEHDRMQAPPATPRRWRRRPRPPHLPNPPRSSTPAMREGQARLTRFLPQDRLDDDAFVLLVQSSGKVFAATAAGPAYVGASIGDFFSEVSTIRRFGDRAGVIETTIDGRPHYAQITLIGDAGGYVVAATSLDHISQLWREELTLNVTLFAGISSILLVILYAYYMQVKRARDADEIFVESNLRVETALSRGRCGLWDFDFDRREFFWSRSMYEMLGLPAADGNMCFGDAARLMHPDDGGIYEIARSIAGRFRADRPDLSACAMPPATMSGCGPAPRSSAPMPAAST